MGLYKKATTLAMPTSETGVSNDLITTGSNTTKTSKIFRGFSTGGALTGRPLPTAGMLSGPNGPIAGMENYRNSLVNEKTRENRPMLRAAGMFM